MSDASLIENSPTSLTGRVEIEKGTSPDNRQQSKIVAVILRNDPNLIGESNIQLKPRERDEYLSRVRQGIIGENEYSELLNNIRAPISYEQDEENPAALFDRISKDKGMRGIVAHFVKESFTGPRFFRPARPL